MRPASIVHPRTGALVWFNQAHLFHSSALAPDVRAAFLAAVGEEGMPRAAYFGDGSPIDDEDIAAVTEAYAAAAIDVQWRAGDLLLLDNEAMAHGRGPLPGRGGSWWPCPGRPMARRADMPVEAEEGFRMSPQQRRLMRYGSLDRLMEAVIIATGDVDGGALHLAVDRAILRHEALRTRFAQLPDGALPLQVIDDAGRGTTRVSVSCAEGTWRVRIEGAAMCLDAASCDVLLSDIAVGYAGLDSREDPPQYADVAAWFNEQLEGTDEAGRAHWAARQPETAGRPAGRAEPRWVARRLAGAGESLRRLARAEGLLPEAAVLAVWHEVLRGTCQAEALVGVVRDGRRFSELEPVVGPLEAVTPIPVAAAHQESLIRASWLLSRELDEAAVYFESLPVGDPAALPGFRWMPERRIVAAAGAVFCLDTVRPSEYPFSVMLAGAWTATISSSRSAPPPKTKPEERPGSRSSARGWRG